MLPLGVKLLCLRIEAKFSRYRPSVVTHINETAGQPIDVDDETADLIGCSMVCYSLSDGMIDITSGALRLTAYRTWGVALGWTPASAGIYTLRT